MRAMNNDERAAEILRAARAALGPDFLEMLIQAAQAVPQDWRDWTSERGFEFLRCRLKFTQDELSEKSGVAQSQISRIEGGGDALLSTWKALYHAMGFKLMLFPVSSKTVAQLEKDAEQGRPQWHWRRQRAKPRRRWKRVNPARPGA